MPNPTAGEAAEQQLSRPALQSEPCSVLDLWHQPIKQEILFDHWRATHAAVYKKVVNCSIRKTGMAWLPWFGGQVKENCHVLVWFNVDLCRQGMAEKIARLVKLVTM